MKSEYKNYRGCRTYGRIFLRTRNEVVTNRAAHSAFKEFHPREKAPRGNDQVFFTTRVVDGLLKLNKADLISVVYTGFITASGI